MPDSFKWLGMEKTSVYKINISIITHLNGWRENMDEFIQWREWKAVEKTGQGQFGTVYKIERDVSGKKETAALKHIHIPQNPADIAEMRSDGYDDESIVATLHDQKESIVGEYNMMQELCGAPNVVICHDIACLQCNGGFGWDIYIIMEL